MLFSLAPKAIVTLATATSSLALKSDAIHLAYLTTKQCKAYRYSFSANVDGKVQMQIEAHYVSDILRGNDTTEMRITLLRYMEDEMPPDDE